MPATFEVRDHALNDNTVVIELTVDLPVFIGEFPVGWLLRGGDESESLVAFISENVVRIERDLSNPWYRYANVSWCASGTGSVITSGVPSKVQMVW